MGLIKRNFDLLDRRAFICLYKALVRSQVEYASSVWSPYRIGINKEIEKVQRRAKKIFKGCKNMSYEERLRNLGLPSLSDRRIRGDLIETFKIIHGYYQKDCVPSLQFQEGKKTRGNELKLQKRMARRDVRKYSFV